MKKLILGIAALPILAVAGPVAAQYNSNNQYQNNEYQYANQGNVNFTARIDQLRMRLQAGVQNGAISRSEAAPIRNQIRQINQLERQYAVNGLSGQERADLQQRIRMVRQQLRIADNRANGRYAQWDNEDGYSQQGYNQGYQPHQQGYAPTQPGGVAGMISQVLGVDGLQVGQRATSNLYAVPQQHQYQYRDGNGVYYRSDGRRIYQIDARTQTVVRVFSM